MQLNNLMKHNNNTTHKTNKIKTHKLKDEKSLEEKVHKCFFSQKSLLLVILYFGEAFIFLKL